MENPGHLDYYGWLIRDAPADPPKGAQGGEGPTEGRKQASLLALGLALIALAFLSDTPAEIWRGSLVLLRSPANLLTDYIALGGAGAALLNAGLMTLTSLLLIRRLKVQVTGPVVAAVFTVAGFSFFGKNLFNSLPILLGIFLYARAARQPPDRFILHCLFGTALGPLVSEFAFNLGLPLPLGLPLAVLAGALAGFLLPPLSVHFLKFHQGLSLYNVGFTAGIVGMLFTAGLRGAGIEVAAVSLLSSGRNAVFAPFLLGLSALLLALGLLLTRGRLRGYGVLLRQAGALPSDFLVICGPGLTLVNMGVMGALSTAYVLLAGGEINGPVIGGILTVTGFSAFGKHPRNALPVMAGVCLASLLGVHPVSSPAALLAALFGTTLAPLSGRFGPLAGVLAGALHLTLVSNVGFLHAGMNLYNNGFSGGFVAAALSPLLEALEGMRKRA